MEERGDKKIRKPELYDQRMFHGSPRQFDRFLMSEIGSGEGTQNEGYGMYLTVDKNVAETYRMRNSGPRPFSDFLQGVYARDASGNWTDRDGNRLGENMRFVLDDLEGKMLGAWDPYALGYILDSVENRYKKFLSPKELSEIQPAVERIREETKDVALPPVGQTYKVEGPEDSTLLNRDAPLSEQPPKVAAVLREHGLYGDPDITGAQLYRRLSEERGGDRQASEYLNTIGIPGAVFDLAYEKTFVIWEPEELRILAKEYPQVSRELRFRQQAFRAMGEAYTEAGKDLPPNANTEIFSEWRSLIHFFEGANAGTAFHELMHHVLNIRAGLYEMNGTADWLKRDHETMLEEYGVTPEEFRSDPKVREEVHERFAKGFEAYLSDGTAPSPALFGVFGRLRKWLIEIYDDVRQALGVEVGDAARGIYDRMLAGPAGREEEHGDPERRSEARDLERRLEREAVLAGRPEREAKDVARVAALAALQMSRASGLPVADFGRISMRQAAYADWIERQQARERIYEQPPLNPDVDPETLVDVVEIGLGRYMEAQLSTPQDLLRHIRGFIGKEAMLSADAKALLEISSNSKAKHLVRSSYRGFTYEEIDVRNAALLSLEGIIRCSALIESYPNLKKNRIDLENVHRFYVPVRSGDRFFTLRLVAHEMKDKAGLKPIRADLYDLIPEKSFTFESLPGSPLAGELPEPTEGETSKITIRAMLGGVKDAYGKNYVESPESYYEPLNPDVDPETLVDVVEIGLGRYMEAQISTPQDLLRHIRGFIGKEAMLSADAKALLEISSNSKAKHLVRSSKPTDTFVETDARNAALLSVDDIVRNSVLIESHPNMDVKKRDLKTVHRLYVPVRAGDELHTLRLVAHEMKDRSGFVPIRADLYDLITENAKRPASLGDSLSGSTLSSAPPGLHESGTSKVTIRAMLDGVKDAYGKNYVESPEIYYEPMNPDVDPETLVDVLEIDTKDFAEAKRATYRDVLKHIRSFIGKEAMLSADAKALLEISSGKKAQHLTWSSKPRMTQKEQNVRATALFTLENIIENAVLVESLPNKKQERIKLLNLHRLYVPMKIGNELFTLRLVVQETKDKSGLTPIRADLYDLIVDKENSTPPNNADPTETALKRAKGGGFKVSIRAMLRGVKDAYGENYFQSGHIARREIKIESRTVVDPESGKPLQWILQDHESGHQVTVRKYRDEYYVRESTGEFQYDFRSPDTLPDLESAQREARRLLTLGAERHIPQNASPQDRHELLQRFLDDPGARTDEDWTRFWDIYDRLDKWNPATWGLTPEETAETQKTRDEVRSDAYLWRVPSEEERAELTLLERILRDETNPAEHGLTREKAEARMDEILENEDKRDERAQERLEAEYKKVEERFARVFRYLAEQVKNIPPTQWTPEEYVRFRAFADRFSSEDGMTTWGLSPSQSAKLEHLWGLDENDPETWTDTDKKERALHLRDVIDCEPKDGTPEGDLQSRLWAIEDEESPEYRALEKQWEKAQENAEKELNALTAETEKESDRLRDLREGLGQLLQDRLEHRLEMYPDWLLVDFHHPAHRGVPSVLATLREAEDTPASDWSPDLRARMSDFAASGCAEEYWGRDIHEHNAHAADRKLDARLPHTWPENEQTADLGYRAVRLEEEIAVEEDPQTRKELRSELAGLTKQAKPIIKNITKALNAAEEANEARIRAILEKALSAEQAQQTARIEPAVGFRVSFHVPGSQSVLTGTVTEVNEERGVVTIRCGSKTVPLVREKGWFSEAAPPRPEETKEYAVAEARKLAGERGQVFFAANEGVYRGPVIGATPCYALQKTGENTVVLHRLKDLGKETGLPEGDVVIRKTAGRAMIGETEAAEKPRAKAKEGAER